MWPGDSPRGSKEGMTGRLWIGKGEKFNKRKPTAAREGGPGGRREPNPSGG